MDELVLEGKVFIKAARAAKNLGYATDYVGQLCRSGKIDAHLIGRTWYVNEEQLGTHRVEKKRMSRVKARAYAKKSIEENRSGKQKTQNTYKNIDIRYESDAENLLPEIKKEKPDVNYFATQADSARTEKKNTKKSEMVEESEKEEDPTVVGEAMYHPEVILEDTSDSTKIEINTTEGKLEALKSISEPSINFTKIKTPKKSKSDTKPRFIERLEREQVDIATPTDDIHEEIPEEKISFPIKDGKKRKLSYILLILFVFILVIVTLPAMTVVEYSANNKSLESHIAFSIPKLLEIIALKI